VILKQQVTDTHQKALQVNLDPQRYGTFAEIGAGQEVARWFFRVGGAAGTIAKSISAYDMKISDAIYGECKRKVSRERLHAMLEREHSLCMDRLMADRGKETLGSTSQRNTFIGPFCGRRKVECLPRTLV
jgi:hypothetical protein